MMKTLVLFDGQGGGLTSTFYHAMALEVRSSATHRVALLCTGVLLVKKDLRVPFGPAQDTHPSDSPAGLLALRGPRG